MIDKPLGEARTCDKNTHTHTGPITKGACDACGVDLTLYAPPQPTSSSASSLDQLISNAIEQAREKARDEIINALKNVGIGHDFQEVRQLVAKEAERLLREDQEVKQGLRDAMIRALNTTTPAKGRW